jgi:tetratricopeptide (TPR) repeat protein
MIMNNRITNFTKITFLFILLYTKGLCSDQTDFPEVIAKIRPAVVLIIADSMSGSGFIISKDGYIVTNEHVVKSSNNITVYINDSDQYSAKVIKSDKEYDLAILKVNASGLTTVNMGDIKKLRTGDEVATTGYPDFQEFNNYGFHIQSSATPGYVNAIKLLRLSRGDSILIIQTDIPTNPGNSGGPLYLRKTGEVMGIHGGKIKNSNRVDLAIGIDLIQRMLREMTIEPQSNPSTQGFFAKPGPVTQTSDLTEFDYLIRGNIAYLKNKYDQAIADYTKALEINPKYVYAYNNRGVTYDDKGNYDQAIADYTKALKINPKYVYAYYNRGIAYSNKGNYDQAIADYTKALKINPKYVEAYYNRGIAYSNKGNYDQAIADYNKALKANPKYVYAYNNRGVAYSNKGNYDQAIADYTKALEINPKYADVYNNRGVAYRNKGNYDQAIADYTKALEINPKYAEAYYNSALCYEKLGTKKMELQMYRHFIEHAPKDDPDLEKARKRIRELEK